MRQFNVDPLYFGQLIDMVERGGVSKLYGKKLLLKLMSGSQNPPLEIARNLGWLQINDDSVVLEFCKSALKENQAIVYYSILKSRLKIIIVHCSKFIKINASKHLLER